MKQKMSKQICFSAFALMCGASSGFAQASELPIPKVNVVDKYGVNLATGQISQSVNTLSIGGPLGLSHSISGFTNNFSFSGYRGYHDKFVAKASYREIGRKISLSGVTLDSLNTLDVSDFGETASFLIYVNGVFKPYISFEDKTPGTVTYVALVDTRHKLEIDSTNDEYLNWTKPDGTVVKFSRDSYKTARSTGVLEKVIYPNGFTISVANAMPASVRTNTGFQLKYNFGAWNTSVDSSKPSPAEPQGIPETSDWGVNPHSIQGINAAIEYCTDDPSKACVLTQSWPIAILNWPNGMPRTLYINNPSTNESGVFSVIDAQKKRTEFHFQAQSLKTDCLGAPAVISPVPSVVPRLIGIKTAESSVINIKYSFCNVASAPDYNGNFLIHPELLIDSEMGKIKSATLNGEGVAYEIAVNRWQGSTDLWNSGGGSNVREVVTRGVNAGNLSNVKTIDGETNFESNWRNFPYSFAPVEGPSVSYGYDARGNLNSVCKNNECTTAYYPAQCTNTKTCNQATWIKDAKNKQTDYTYHQESGQVETVTLPANKNGVRAQTRYEYTAFSARYYDRGGALVNGSPIWLKTAERSCIKSNYSGGCGSDDQEVVTRYEYNSKNLFLTGVTLSADSKILRTCFQYDIYGNQIGKTQPKAGLASCPQ